MTHPPKQNDTNPVARSLRYNPVSQEADCVLEVNG